VFFLALALTPFVSRELTVGSAHGSTRRWYRILLLVLYFFSVAVVILMETVEIVGLARTGLGIALIPFVYAGYLVAATLQASDGLRGRLKAWRFVNLLFWTLSACITSAKLAAVTKFGTDGPLARSDTLYAVHHQINNLSILVGFYVLLMLVEIAIAFAKPAPTYGAGGAAVNGDVKK
jgi:hypothetical protein